MTSIFIKVDKECVDNAVDIIRKIIDDNDCESSSIHRRGIGADGKEWFSYVIYGDDSEKKELVNNIIKNHDWSYEGITGFEIPVPVSSEETEVELHPIGIVDEKDYNENTQINNEDYNKHKSINSELIKKIKENKYLADENTWWPMP